VTPLLWFAGSMVLAAGAWSWLWVPKVLKCLAVIWKGWEKGLDWVFGWEHVVSAIGPQRTALQRVSGADRSVSTIHQYQFVTTCPKCHAPGNPYFCGFIYGVADYPLAMIGNRPRYLRRQCQLCGEKWPELLDTVPAYRWPEDPKPKVKIPDRPAGGLLTRGQYEEIKNEFLRSMRGHQYDPVAITYVQRGVPGKVIAEALGIVSLDEWRQR